MLLLLSSLAFAQTQPCEPLAYDPPDDTTAVLLSSAVGFGAGHYYAGQPQVGRSHLALQSLGLFTMGGWSLRLRSIR